MVNFAGSVFTHLQKLVYQWMKLQEGLDSQHVLYYVIGAPFRDGQDLSVAGRP